VARERLIAVFRIGYDGEQIRGMEPGSALIYQSVMRRRKIC